MRQAKSLAAMALNAYSFIPIDLGYVALSSIVLQCRTAKDVLISTDPQGGNYFTLKSGTSLSLDLEGGVLDISLGTEILTNGTFTGNANGWTLGSNWAYGSNKVAHSSGATATLSQTGLAALTVGAFYKLEYTTTYGSATITPSIADVTLPARTVTGTYIEYFGAVIAGTSLVFTPGSTSTGDLDTISLKRVTYPSNQRPIFLKGSEAGLYVEILAIQ
jgi:hypothetical protein